MYYYDGCIGVMRREILRIILEKIKGVRLENEIKLFEAHKDDPGAKYEVEEILNIPYMNRREVPLAMDIFKPVVPDKQEIPVIITIHGGGLVIGDRRMSRLFAKKVASYGYLVFSIEYRHAPRANSAEQLDDVCAGLDIVGRRLIEFDVDLTRFFLVADSAGAYLATYVAAMKNSVSLQEAIGYEPANMRFAALGLISGMFYTNRPDPIGLLLSEQFYGDKRTDERFLQYMDPEHFEIVDNLPPVFFVTSRGDFLNNYTLMYHRKLKESGKKTKLIYYGEYDLGHSFVTICPWHKKSIDAIEKMMEWFEERVNGKKQIEPFTQSNMNKEPESSDYSENSEGGIFNDPSVKEFLRSIFNASDIDYYYED